MHVFIIIIICKVAIIILCLGIEWLPNPPPKHSVTLNLDVANSGLTLKSFSASSGHQFTSPIDVKGVNAWKLRPKLQIGKMITIDVSMRWM